MKVCINKKFEKYNCAFLYIMLTTSSLRSMLTRSVSLQSGSVLHIYCAPFAKNLATAAVLSTTAPFCEIVIFLI